MRTILLVALFLVNLSAIPRSTAEPSPVGRWLMNQPMSLWDWGMFEASRNAERIAEYAERSIGKVAYGHAGYDWKSNEIEMRMIVSDYHAETSHENCNKVRRTFIGQVAGTWSLRDENHVRTSLRSKIDTWFSHRGYQNETRDKELGQKMSRIVFVKIDLSNKSGSIACRERIMVFDAPSNPKRSPDSCDPNNIFHDILKDLC